MTRNYAQQPQNNFSKGMITEATGLGFPENAVIDAENTEFVKIGQAIRRKGIDFEEGAVTFGEAWSADGSPHGAIREFIWQSVALSGGFTFLVVQSGTYVGFFEMSTSGALSSAALPGTINLVDYKTPQATVEQVRTNYCSFSSGAGSLYICHPNCDPVSLKYDEVLGRFEASRIKIYVRDFEGLEDGLGVDERPRTLSKEHNYNLKNQGWYKMVRVGRNRNGIKLDGEPETKPPMLIWDFIFARLGDRY